MRLIFYYFIFKIAILMVNHKNIKLVFNDGSKTVMSNNVAVEQQVNNVIYFGRYHIKVGDGDAIISDYLSFQNDSRLVLIITELGYIGDIETSSFKPLIPPTDITYNQSDQITQVLVYNDVGKTILEHTINITYPSGEPVCLGATYKGMSFNPSTFLFQYNTTHPTSNIIGVTLSANTVNEDASVDTVIGTLNPIGGTDPVIFTIVSDTNDAFKIGGMNLDELHLKTQGVLDFVVEQGEYCLTVRATDVKSKVFDQEFCIYITPITFVNTKCLSLTGTELVQRLNMAAEPISTISGDMSISYWINAGVSGYILLGRNTGAADFKFRHIVYSTDRIRWGFQDGVLDQEWRNINTGIDVFDGFWHNVITTLGTTSEMYIDGVLQTKTQYSNDTLTTTSIINELLIGSAVPSTPNTSFIGKLNELAIWDKELTQNDATALYNSGVPTDLRVRSDNTNLVAYYSFENETDGFLDKSVNSQTLTGVNIDSSNFVVL